MAPNTETRPQYNPPVWVKIDYDDPATWPKMADADHDGTIAMVTTEAQQ
jgi:hypothetical protein